MIDNLNEHQGMTREEQLAVDVPQLLGEGISDETGMLRGVVQGLGQTAAALQIQDAGMPLEMLGRILTMINRHSFEAAVIDIDVIVEEPERRGYPKIAAIVRAGIGSCCNDTDYRLLARWLANVYALIALRETVQSAEVHNSDTSEAQELRDSSDS